METVRRLGGTLEEKWRALPPGAIDIVFALLVLVVELGYGVSQADPGCNVCRLTPGRWLVIAGMSLPLVLRRRFPMAVFVAVGLMAGYNAIVDGPALNVGILVAVYSVAAYATAGVAWLSGLLVVAALVVIHASRGFTSYFRADLMAFIPMWLLGRLTASRRIRMRELLERALLAEREREQRVALATADERRRIARELHDVVAHTMSVMVLHAGNARESVGDDLAAARRSLEVIESAGRGAIDELGRVLDVLRDGHDGSERAPQPGIDDIPHLIEAVRRAGLPVEHRVEGQRKGVGASVGLSLFRVVQESLANAARHATPTTVLVRERWRPDRVELTVESDGAPDLVLSGAPRTGHGLIGIRERVEMFGGLTEIGPDGAGRFIVRVAIPLRLEGDSGPNEEPRS